MKTVLNILTTIFFSVTTLIGYSIIYCKEMTGGLVIL